MGMLEGSVRERERLVADLRKRKERGRGGGGRYLLR